MPRRVYTYPAEMGWGPLNLVASLGALTIVISMIVFVFNVGRTLRSPRSAESNPWQADTLEWLADSPPQPGNFVRLPVVGAREPMWDSNGVAGEVGGLATDQPELLITTALEALPDHRNVFPTPSLWPLIAAVATTVMFIGSIFTPWAVVWGSIPIIIAMIAWFWPTKAETRQHLALEKAP
jgi:hypothetical protein